MSIEMYCLRPGKSNTHRWRALHTQLQFPGGEIHVFPGLPLVHPLPGDHQLAVLRGGSSDDLMALAMWAEFTYPVGKRIAVIPYLPGARQDHDVPQGAAVYADLINSMHLEHVICFDPHSPVMPELVNNCTTVPLASLPYWDVIKGDYVGVIAPDKGAHERATSVAERLGVPVFQAEKHRDQATGKLSGFSCEQLPEEGCLLVVDDICDGGGTFMGLADATGLPRTRLHLWVSHGIFSGTAGRLTEKYGRVSITDSHPGHLSRSGLTIADQVFPILDHCLRSINLGKEN